MTLEDLGYNETLNSYRVENKLEDFAIGRVIAEHKERYIVKNDSGEFEAEVTGNLRFSAQSREDFPAVGDWVTIIPYDSDNAIIQSILPRHSVLARQAVGKYGEKQIIATNIDVGFIMQAVDRDFNINRIERYITICNASKVDPVIVLTKTDLIDCDRLNNILENIKLRIKHIPIFAISNQSMDGYDSLISIIQKGKTYCLLGSSGVGKSTLTNKLSGKELMKTNAISKSTNKGRHITSHRELTILENGGILIDNPGMREIGVVDSSEALENTFQEITELSLACKFSDCSHINEVGCAVLDAVERGEVDSKTYENFLKIEREKEHFDLTVSEKRKKDKAFGKMVKGIKNDMKQINAKHKE